MTQSWQQEWRQEAERAAERLNQQDIARGVATFLAWAHRRAQSRERPVSVCFWKNRAQRRAEAVRQRKAWKRIQREAKKQVLRELRQPYLGPGDDMSPENIEDVPDAPQS